MNYALRDTLFVHHVAGWMAIFLSGGHILLLNDMPEPRIEFRKMSVPVNLGQDASQVNAIGKGQGLRIDLTPADHADFRDACFDGKLSPKLDRFFQRPGDRRSGSLKPLVSRHHDIRPAWQGAADGLPGPSPHDDRLSERQGPEALEIRG